jgi:hypothetical protein
MWLAVERRTVREDATREEISYDRLPMAKYDRFRRGIQVRRIDAGIQTAQPTVRREAADAARGSGITFIDDDQLG